MSPLVPVGLAIALNVGILGGGLFWMTRQVKRVAAERTAAQRGLFVLEPLPPAGDEVLVLVADEQGRLTELDAVYRPHPGWMDARTMLPVDNVLGWRRRPDHHPAVAVSAES